MIYVCDAIMGSGKTQSAITFMNEHPENKYIYITPFLDETERIASGCPELNFQLPDNRVPEGDFTKIGHTRILLKDGQNIATTHEAFRRYGGDILESIRSGGYVLIADEAVSILDKTNFNKNDVLFFQQCGVIKEEDGVFKYAEGRYEGSMLTEFFKTIECNNLLATPSGATFYWRLPVELLKCFKDAYVLTYLFQYSDMYRLLKMNKMEYQPLWISRSEDVYRFSDHLDYVPEYVARIRDLIHIVDNERMNEVGKRQKALSKRWYSTDYKNRSSIVRKNLNTYVRSWHKNDDVENVMWSVYKCHVKKIQGKGFTRRFVNCTSRATNAYRNCTILAYCVNLFEEPTKVDYYRARGIEIDQDGYALSIMIQWIWRSAIRDGKPIELYLPSRRMRKILVDWMESLPSSVPQPET